MQGKWKGFLRLGVLTAVALALAFGAMMGEAKAPLESDGKRQETEENAVGAAEQGETVGKDCAIIQTMGFTRCGHSVSRRVKAEETLTGANFAAVQERYAQWRIDSFGKDEIVMSREIPLFCPMHHALHVNEAGEVVLSRNLYGDGMAVEKSYGLPLERFSEEDKAALLRGIGFDSQADAEAWLAAR